MPSIRILHGDCVELMRQMDECSVDAVVTDPPAGISFMSKEWDDFRRARNPADAERDSVHGRMSAQSVHMEEDWYVGCPAPTTIDDGIDEAIWTLEVAMEEEGPIEKVFLLLSGGNDSMVLLDVLHDVADEIVHINTGIGIPETNQFVRDVIAGMGRELIELHPPRPYEELILDDALFGGFPGPGAHHFIYARLKERCVRALLKSYRTKHGQRFLLLTGIRNDESKRRMGYASAVNRIGGQVWVNPLLRWSNELMREYRTERGLPINEVTANLHMSGECLCGAFAHPGELEEIAFFYPAFAERIRALEAECRLRGLPAAKWGERPPSKKQVAAAGPLCSSCVDP